MKTRHLFHAVLVISAMASTAGAKDLPIASCPAPVQETIRAHAGRGKVDDIKVVSGKGGKEYVVDIDRPGDLDRKLHISATGALLKVREEIPLAKAPSAVREAAAKHVPAGGRIDDVQKTTAGSDVTYEVEVDRPNVADLKLVFSPAGAVLSKREER